MTQAIDAGMVPALVRALEPWRLANVVGPAEVHAAVVLTRSAATPDSRSGELVQLAAALALRAPLHGDSCLDLVHARETIEADIGRRADEPREDGTDSSVVEQLPWPDVDEWLATVTTSELVRLVDRHEATPPLDQHPLVLHGTKLYTQRQWVDECSVAVQLLGRARAASLPTVSAASLDLLAHVLPPVEGGEPNAQHEAVLRVVSSRLSVIVGGPGTGKTHTVARLLAVLVHDSLQQGTPLRIGLAAPTGKAATRLRDALVAAAESLPEEVAVKLREVQAFTIHRLLGWKPRTRTRFAHDGRQPLPFDVIVVDETSMVAMPLMARLLEATPGDARLVLVGDPDQLESIEVGAVLHDVVAAATTARTTTDKTPNSPLDGHVIRLTRPRRHSATSLIGPLADAIREDRADDVLAMLRGPDPLVTFIDHADPLGAANGAGVRDLVVPPLAAMVDAAGDGRVDDAVDALAGIRIICAHRHGPHGAEAWNRAIETWLFGSPPRTRFYPGRALLATRNDLRQHIANGDTGVVVTTPDGTHAAFVGSGGVNLLSPAQLEEVETSFATTIHKSQGSEYELVVVVLAPPTSPILGRELLYTAVTRTTSRLVVVGTEEAIIEAVHRPSRRVTGLEAALATGELG